MIFSARAKASASPTAAHARAVSVSVSAWRAIQFKASLILSCCRSGSRPGGTAPSDLCSETRLRCKTPAGQREIEIAVVRRKFRGRRDPNLRRATRDFDVDIVMVVRHEVSCDPHAAFHIFREGHWQLKMDILPIIAFPVERHALDGGLDACHKVIRSRERMTGRRRRTIEPGQRDPDHGIRSARSSNCTAISLWPSVNSASNSTSSIALRVAGESHATARPLT